MFSYSPPAGIDDLAGRPSRTGFLADWHVYIHKTFKENIDGLGVADPLFFTEVDRPAQSPPVPIHWNGFPLPLLREAAGSHPKAWKAAEVLRSTTRYTPAGTSPVRTGFRPQDEYCEWFVYRESGQLKRIVFTAEGPEYWIHLSRRDIDAVLALYQKYVSPAVKKPDLLLTTDLNFSKDLVLHAGDYNPFNPWNTMQGVMHLTHPANTLGAEINLAAFATLPRKDRSGARVTDVRRLICCAGYGVANRSSDPNIGWSVNTTCTGIQSGAPVQAATLADPVGLYIEQLQPGSLTGPDDEPINHWFSVVRGGVGRGLMAVLEAPAGSPFALDRVKVKGVKLEWGGQVAECIDMVLYAKVAPFASAPPTMVACDAHCCMPAGTAPNKIKDINLVQPDGACATGEVDAYPELVGQQLEVAHGLEAIAGPAPAKLRSRLDAE